MLKYGLHLILEFSWMLQMLKLGLIYTEQNSKIYLNYQMDKQTHLHHNVLKNSVLKNSNVCLLKIFISLFKLHFSQFNLNMIHGLFPILLEFLVMITQIFQNVQINKWNKQNNIIEQQEMCQLILVRNHKMDFGHLSVLTMFILKDLNLQVLCIEYP